MLEKYRPVYLRMPGNPILTLTGQHKHYSTYYRMRLVPAPKEEKGASAPLFLFSATDLIQKGKNRRRPVGIERLDQTDSGPVESQWIV